MFPLAEGELGFWSIAIVFAYLICTVYLGWLGYTRTKTAADYLIAGRRVHPFVMALSYGATFISTSAIVGFGGVAGLFGMSLLWLTFCNIFIGIFIAFVFLAPAVRRMGHQLDAHTFPELLGRRFDSKFIQVAIGLIIFLFIPLYAAAVLIGACKFISVQFGVHYDVALLVFTLIIAAYVVVGGVFILAMTGIAFTVGAVSNAYFTQHGTPFTGRVAKVINAEKNQAVLQVMKQDGDKWVDAMKEDKGAMVPVMVPVVLTGEQVSETVIDDASIPIVQGRSISIVYAKGDLEQIIPIFINFATPKWFGLVFLLVLLSAAMSTLSSQFHAVGTSIGRDVYERITDSKPGIAVTRTGILVGIIIAVVISHYAADKGIIARATGIFFGLCASAFLPALLGALFLRRMTKAGAIASIIAGFLVTAFWLILVKEKEAADIGLVQLLTNGQKSIFYNHPNWPNVDSLLIALPISLIVAIVVSLVTQPPSKEHLDKCFS